MTIGLSTWRAFTRRVALAGTLLAIAVAVLPGCGQGEETLTVYSGRSQSLIDPLLGSFSEQTGIDVRVKYAGSAAIAATILEEGDNTPADVVFLQDPGSLGALSAAGVLRRLPDGLLAQVDGRFRSRSDEWVGTSGRARAVVYNTSAVDPDRDLPGSVMDFTAPSWKGRVGWAPQNGSFQAFVTAMRTSLGESETRRWLEGMQSNDARAYSNNTSIVAAVGRGEVDVGLVNHYYLARFLEEEGPGFGARNHFLRGGDPGALVLVAGAGILKASGNDEAAERFIEYLLSSRPSGTSPPRRRSSRWPPACSPRAGFRRSTRSTRPTWT